MADVRRQFRPRLLDPEELVKHVDRLYRAAWAMCGHAHDAEDLVQEIGELVAVDVLGLSYAEAGRAVGAKEATVTTRLHRARTRLAERPELAQVVTR